MLFWSYLALVIINLFAGIGVKWLIDRVFGQQVQVVLAAHRGVPETGRRVVELDDTMDVLGAGFAAGERSAQARQPAGASGTWEPKPAAVIPSGGGV